MLVRVVLILIVVSLGAGNASAVETFSPPERIVPVCGMIVAAKRKSEVERTGTYDKFRHCSLSCVMALQCGPFDAMEAGILKEIYDALGFGDPSMDDLRADLAGTQIGIARDVHTRVDCYRECDRIYPKNSRPAEKF